MHHKACIASKIYYTIYIYYLLQYCNSMLLEYRYTCIANVHGVLRTLAILECTRTRVQGVLEYRYSNSISSSSRVRSRVLVLVVHSSPMES